VKVRTSIKTGNPHFFKSGVRLSLNYYTLLYGISPQWFFETFLVDSQSPSIDQSHILRAVMMLYIALGLFWLYSAFSDKYRDAGLVVLAVFCGGLVTGRILSVIVDGTPSPLLSEMALT